MPTTVIVTRPYKAGELLARNLIQRGYQVLNQPLLNITPLDTEPPQLAKTSDAVMITSANALDVLDTTNALVQTLLPLPCYVVGERTGQAARAFGFRNVIMGTGNSADLATKIVEQQKAPQTILHIAGADVEDSGKTILEKAGHKVSVWPVYTAIPANELTHETIHVLQSQKNCVFLLYSTRTAENLMLLLKKHRLLDCAHHTSVVGISDSVLTPLRAISWQNLTSADSPNENAVLAKLSQLYPPQ